MNKDYIHVSFLIDRSGSMFSMAAEAKSGFDSFVEDQKELDGKVTFTLAQFDTEYEDLENFTDVKNVKTLDNYGWHPRGATALNDALSRIIDNTGKRLSDLEEKDRPAKVLVVVFTDGLENSSKEITGSQLREKIKHQEEKYNWQIIFMGNDATQIQEGAALGIDNSKMFQYANASQGLNTLSRSVSAYRTEVASCTNENDVKTCAFLFADDQVEEGDK